MQVPATRDEIAALAGTMNDLLGRLQRALARQRAFVADASHELRSPLAVLRGELELAGRPGRSRDDLAATVRNATAETDRLARITDGLLLLARGDEEGLGLRLERTDIGPLLTRSAVAVCSRLDAAGVTCRVDVPAGVCAVVEPSFACACRVPLVRADRVIRLCCPAAAACRGGPPAAAGADRAGKM